MTPFDVSLLSKELLRDGYSPLRLLRSYILRFTSHLCLYLSPYNAPVHLFELPHLGLLHRGSTRYHGIRIDTQSGPFHRAQSLSRLYE